MTCSDCSGTGRIRIAGDVVIGCRRCDGTGSVSFLKNSKLWNSFPEEYIPMTEKLVAALQFYAQQRNWEPSNYDSYLMIDSSDWEFIEDGDIGSGEYGGKRARDVLNELGIVFNEENE